jgi:phage terminase small subunit
MPRKSVASIITPSPKLQSVRLQPPAYLTKQERAEFVALVMHNKAEAFRPSDLPLLVAYSQIIAQLQEASKQIHKGVVHEGKISPWISVQERLIKSMVALSMRLRLSPQSRAPNNPSRPVKPMSAYEELANGYLDDKPN